MNGIYANDFAVIDFEESKCGDCVHVKVCKQLKTIEELWDPFLSIRIVVKDCGAYDHIKEAQAAG